MFLPPRLRTRLTLVESAHERRQSVGERVRGNISECRPQPVRECQRELIESPESRTEHHNLAVGQYVPPPDSQSYVVVNSTYWELVRCWTRNLAKPSHLWNIPIFFVVFRRVSRFRVSRRVAREASKC